MKLPFTLTLPKELGEQITAYRDDLQARVNALEARRTNAAELHSQRLLELEALKKEISALEAEGAKISDESVNKLVRLNAKLPAFNNSFMAAATEKAAANNASTPLEVGEIMSALGEFYTEAVAALLWERLEPFCAEQHQLRFCRENVPAMVSLREFRNTYPWWAGKLATPSNVQTIMPILARALEGDPCLFFNSLARRESTAVGAESETAEAAA